MNFAASSSRRFSMDHRVKPSEGWDCAVLDCFVAEPVIGPATSGRTRWLLAMTTLHRE